MNRWISITAAVLIGVALTMLLIIGPKTGSVENLRNTILTHGPWGIAISIGLMVGQAIIAPLPMNVVTITNALVFGPIWGSLLSWFSTVLGASLCFLLSRTFGKPFAHRIVGDSIQKAESFFQKYGLHAMFLAKRHRTRDCPSPAYGFSPFCFVRKKMRSDLVMMSKPVACLTRIAGV